MTDTRLLILKHGRIILPLTAIFLVLAIVRSISNELVVQQIYGIGVMLLSVAFTIYSLDSIIRLIGLCEDQLLLLSPWSRWRLCVVNVSVLAAYLFVAQLVSQIPYIVREMETKLEFASELASYFVSTVSGLGLMVLLVYALKGVARRFNLLIGVWVSYALCVLLACFTLIKAVKFLDSDFQWILGVTAQDYATNLYATILPITFYGKEVDSGTFFTLTGANLLLGILFWIFAWTLSSLHKCYLELT